MSSSDSSLASSSSEDMDVDVAEGNGGRAARSKSLYYRTDGWWRGGQHLDVGCCVGEGTKCFSPTHLELSLPLRETQLLDASNSLYQQRKTPKKGLLKIVTG